MSLDHPYTCPKIDTIINQARDVIYDHVYDIILEHNPWLGQLGERYIPEQTLGKIKEDADGLTEVIEDLLEEARSCNEDMRSAADKQISELEDQIEELEDEVSNLQPQIKIMRMNYEYT